MSNEDLFAQVEAEVAKMTPEEIEAATAKILNRKRSGKKARVAGGGRLQTAADAPDWAGAIAAVDTALEKVDALGRAEFDRPGDRQRVGELLGSVRSALVGAAGTIREARGASAAVNAQRRAVRG